jgi:hypothetical protein
MKCKNDRENGTLTAAEPAMIIPLQLKMQALSMFRFAKPTGNLSGKQSQIFYYS